MQNPIQTTIKLKNYSQLSQFFRNSTSSQRVHELWVEKRNKRTITAISSSFLLLQSCHKHSTSSHELTVQLGIFQNERCILLFNSFFLSQKNYRKHKNKKKFLENHFHDLWENELLCVRFFVRFYFFLLLSYQDNFSQVQKHKLFTKYPTDHDGQRTHKDIIIHNFSCASVS